jgi:hypothetical protein
LALQSSRTTRFSETIVPTLSVSLPPRPLITTSVSAPTARVLGVPLIVTSTTEPSKRSSAEMTSLPVVPLIAIASKRRCSSGSAA